jgi:hypothetical protein
MAEYIIKNHEITEPPQNTGTTMLRYETLFLESGQKDRPPPPSYLELVGEGKGEEEGEQVGPQVTEIV